MASKIINLREVGPQGAAERSKNAAFTGIPRNHWYAVASPQEVGRSLLRRKLLGDNVVFYRTENGDPVAFSDWCPHRGFPLSKGTLIGNDIQCGYHGLRFGPDGQCTKIPSQTTGSKYLVARSYPVIERGRWIWIWMGDPEKADPSLILSTPHDDRPGYHETFICCFPMAGNFQLLHENLLDATHASFLHAGAIDNAETEDSAPEIAGTDFDFEVEGAMIRTTRMIKDFVPTGPNAELLDLEPGKPLDRLFVTEHHFPGYVYVVNRFTEAGKPDNVVQEVITHFPIVPASETECYHFGHFTTSYPWSDIRSQMFMTVLEQDAVGIEGVQRAAENAPEWWNEANIRADTPGLRARRIMADLLKEEA